MVRRFSEFLSIKLQQNFYRGIFRQLKIHLSVCHFRVWLASSLNHDQNQNRSVEVCAYVSSSCVYLYERIRWSIVSARTLLLSNRKCQNDLQHLTWPPSQPRIELFLITSSIYGFSKHIHCISISYQRIALLATHLLRSSFELLLSTPRRADHSQYDASVLSICTICDERWRDGETRHKTQNMGGIFLSFP